ncbi:MAG: VacB/RNase II family 3'-5' exoribonuclease, partial [Bacilli bacterium]|nr:VacB/RNase II family 3'-5' exoribonuclease [Bacilli bacterium]
MKEDIIAVLEKSGIALDLLAISDELNLKTAEDLRNLADDLEDLVRDFVVYKTKKDKYMLYSKCANFKMGKLSVNKKGFGFLIVKDGEDIHISKDNLGYALDKDEVLVEIIESDGKKYEGRVLKVIKRDLSNIVGIIKSDGKNIYFEPKGKLQIELEITKESMDSCVEGEIVVVKTIDDLGKNRYSAEVVKHICHKDDANEDILTIAAQYEIYPEFPEEAMKEAEELPNEVLDSDRVGRRDLTSKKIVTIDDITTKDIDDAISIEREGDLYVLGVHIADVSYYVKENSPLDKEAFERGTSSYLADSVIPQLPHKLSNGICSLNPNVDRCAITCEMKINDRGMVVDSDIYPSVINSKKKMTYASVNHYLMERKVDEGYEDFTEMMDMMQELAHIIRAERVHRGASDFGTDEPKIICDENGRAIDIKKREQLEGEKLIEDFMVAANETVARTISQMGIPSIYRVHDVPKEEKIAAYITFCVSAGRMIKGKYKTMNPHMFQKLLDQVTTGDETDAIFRSMAVRCMPKAKYDTNNIGHFGLASMNYTHFTSPIRRYPDLQVHRILRTCLFM